MVDIQNFLQNFIQRNSKRLIGFGLLAVSIIAALVLASAGQSKDRYWVANHTISIGDVIAAQDISLANADLGTAAIRYYPNTSLLVGEVAQRSISQGEWIPKDSLVQRGASQTTRQLPIGIGRSDLPADLGRGDLVDLYWIPKDVKEPSNLIVSGIRVFGVDLKSRDLGGLVNVIFSIEQREILNVTDAIGTGRIVVVRNAL